MVKVYIALLLAVVAATDHDRRIGAVTGGFLADAAVMPLHWIYDTSEIATKVDRFADGDPAFFSPPISPFYTYAEGENTPYGQQTRVYLSTLASSPIRPRVDPVALQNAYYANYGPTDAPCHDRQTSDHQAGCYWDGSTKKFVENYEDGQRWPHVGAIDSQANAIAHMVPVVAALAGQDGMLAEVEKAIRVTQDTDDAVAFGLAAARVLRGAILGSSPLDAVQAAVAELQDPQREHPMAEDADLADGLQSVLGQLDQPNIDVVRSIGQACEYPFNLLTGSHLLAQTSGLGLSATEAFMNATRQNIMAGGDQASRGFFVGAVWGAVAGEAALPRAWRTKYLHYNEVRDQTSSLLGAPSAVVAMM